MSALPNDTVTLPRLTRECVDATNSTQDAANMLLNRLREYPDLFSDLMEPYEQQAALSAVSAMTRVERRKVWVRPSSPDGRVAALANINASLMSFRLPGGKPISLATAEDLRAASSFYEMQSNDMAWKARWLARLAERLTGDEILESRLSEQDLALAKDETK